MQVDVLSARRNAIDLFVVELLVATVEGSAMRRRDYSRESFAVEVFTSESLSPGWFVHEGSFLKASSIEVAFLIGSRLT
jgi:hypothetical protein